MGANGPERAQQFQLRMSDDLHHKLKMAAADNSRSMNTEMVHRLSASFDAAKAIHPELARVVEQYLEAEVQSRLRAIAARLTSGADA